MTETVPYYVVKTDGLAGGKGVLVTASWDEATADIKAKVETGTVIVSSFTDEPARDTADTQTPMRLHVAEDWPTRDGALLRRVGWLDQKGRVWIAMPPQATFDGGSLTPLLIDVGDD